VGRAGTRSTVRAEAEVPFAPRVIESAGCTRAIIASAFGHPAAQPISRSPADVAASREKSARH
jgi:hypothetical protein